MDQLDEKILDAAKPIPLKGPTSYMILQVTGRISFWMLLFCGVVMVVALVVNVWLVSVREAFLAIAVLGVLPIIGLWFASVVFVFFWAPAVMIMELHRHYLTAPGTYSRLKSTRRDTCWLLDWKTKDIVARPGGVYRKQPTEGWVWLHGM